MEQVLQRGGELACLRRGRPVMCKRVAEQLAEGCQRLAAALAINAAATFLISATSADVAVFT